MDSFESFNFAIPKLNIFTKNHGLSLQVNFKATKFYQSIPSVNAKQINSESCYIYRPSQKSEISLFPHGAVLL